MGRIEDTNKFLIDGFHGLCDIFIFIFGDNEDRDILRKVPSFCRWDCGDWRNCRDKNNNWKCKRGCWLARERKINYRSYK